MADLLSDAKARLMKRRAVVSRLHAAHRAQERDAGVSVFEDVSQHDLPRPDVRALRRIAERESIELLEIDSALARIDAHTYGRCERCAGAIGRLRLVAVPEGRLCIRCTS